jgi:hypothetical protein
VTNRQPHGCHDQQETVDGDHARQSGSPLLGEAASERQEDGVLPIFIGTHILAFFGISLPVVQVGGAATTSR